MSFFGGLFVKKNINENQIPKRNVLAFYPTGEFYFIKGVKAFQKGDYRLAKKYLKRAWQLAPHEPLIACQYAIVLTETEEYKDSNAILLKVLKDIKPTMHECHYFLANNYAYLGLYKEAITHARLYLNNDPRGEFAEDAKELLEVISMEEGDFPGQIFKEDEIIENHERAKMFLADGKFDEAIVLLTDLIQAYPDFWPAYNNLALAHYYNGERKLAKDLIDRVLEGNPGNLHALCNLAIFSFYEGQSVEPMIEVLTKIHPISTDHRFKLGVTLTILGEYETGFQWLKSIRMLGFQPDASYYYWLAIAAYYAEDKELAQKTWAHLVEIDPEKSGMEPWKTSKIPNPF